MSDREELTTLHFELGSLTKDELQAELDEVLAELRDPESEASRAQDELKIEVLELLRADERKSGFVLEGLAIALLVKFAEGAAAAAGGVFFTKVVLPRIARRRADGLGKPLDPPDPTS